MGVSLTMYGQIWVLREARKSCAAFRVDCDLSRETGVGSAGTHFPRRYAMFCESENVETFLYLFLCFVLRKQPSHVNPTPGVINEAPGKN